jgi:hypothetical protein
VGGGPCAHGTREGGYAIYEQQGHLAGRGHSPREGASRGREIQNGVCVCVFVREIEREREMRISWTSLHNLEPVMRRAVFFLNKLLVCIKITEFLHPKGGWVFTFLASGPEDF